MDGTKLSLKLLIDREKESVVLAESQRDFIDVLFSILTLPMGTIIRVLDKQSLVGCMDWLYESVEKLDPRFMVTKACKTMLLHPSSAAEGVCEGLKLQIDDNNSRIVYRCPYWDCFKKMSLLYSPYEDANCPNCGRNMDGELEFVKNGAKGDGVFIKGEGSFTITDDLHVIPTCTDGTLRVLNKFGVKDITALEEMNVEIRMEEMLNLLNRLLLSDTPLTDVFVRKMDVNEDADKLEKDQKPSSIKCEATTGTDKMLKLKLVLSKSRNIVMYAEAGGDVVDFLFSFLTFPIGSIIKLLSKYSCLGCLDNLYKSIEELINTDKLADSEECARMLLSPELASMFACTSQLLSIQEKDSEIGEITGCKDCFYQGFFFSNGIKCKHGIEPVNLLSINPKLPCSGPGSGGGFTKGREVFMITDELEVTPLSSIYAIQTVSRWGIPPSDLDVREVSLGEAEALKLLKASLISKRALSNVFCQRKRKSLA